MSHVLTLPNMQGYGGSSCRTLGSIPHTARSNDGTLDPNSDLTTKKFFVLEMMQVPVGSLSGWHGKGDR